MGDRHIFDIMLGHEIEKYKDQNSHGNFILDPLLYGSMYER